MLLPRDAKPKTLALPFRRVKTPSGVKKGWAGFGDVGREGVTLSFADLLLLFLVMNEIQKRRFFSLSRLIYFLLFTVFITIFTARLACEDLGCTVLTLKLYFSGGNCKDVCIECKKTGNKKTCEDCKICDLHKPNWKIREGFDEAGLILLGTCFVFLILVYKNHDGRLMLRNLSKISFFGAVEFEIEKIEKEISQLEKNRFSEIDTNVKIEFIEALNRIISRSSDSNEMLHLITIEIEKHLNNLYEITAQQPNTTINSPIEIISYLKNKGSIDTDLAKLLTHFFEIKTIDVIHKRGKNTISLIEIGKRILLILFLCVKNAYDHARKFWGKITNMKVDRSQVEEASPDKIVLIYDCERFRLQ